MIHLLLLFLAGPPTRPSVTIAPAHPVQGAFIVIRAKPAADDSSLVSLSGHFAGEPLHFERDSSGTFIAYAGIPVEAHGALPLPIVLERSDGVTDSMVVPVPVVSAHFAMESLKVDPRYTNKPDSALAARVARENEDIRQAWLQSHQTPRLWQGPFLRPRPGRITSVFGTGREFNGVVASRHLGTDFDGTVGATIRASNSGVISLVGEHYYSGNIVVINHGEGISTAYLHMSKVLVAVGDTVKTGQLIGLVGSTGRVTGPHLHWIAKYGTISLNPLTLIDATAPPNPPAPVRKRPPPARNAKKA